jgi:hypothetical protein
VEQAVLLLLDMAERHPGLTRPIAGAYAEAACVCLDRHHTSPINFTIATKASRINASTTWERSNNRIVGAWANETDATEFGAYGCALAAVELAEGLCAVRRAESLSGADYYVAPIDDNRDDLEACIRLEISGIDAGSQSDARRRLRQKVRQASLGRSSLPAMAIVVGFKILQILVEHVAERGDA